MLLAAVPAVAAVPDDRPSPPPADDLDALRAFLQATPGPAESLEPDLRELPWPTLRRLTLLGGVLPPAYVPATGEELVRLLLPAAADTVALSRYDARMTARLLHHHGLGAGGGAVLYGCRCKQTPLDLRLDGRAVLAWQELGGPVPGEAGLGLPPGLSAALEPRLSAWAGRWWASVSVRLQGRVIDGGRAPAEPFLYHGWPLPTGRPQLGRWRLDDGPWRATWPRVITGLHLGNWSVTAGQTAVQAGPGYSGGLTLSSTAAPFPAVTVRRTRPFGWRGFWRYLAPAQLLVRLGSVSEQDVRYREQDEVQTHRTRPMFGQWLVGWEWTSWWRFSASLAALAAAREGDALWPLLPQVLFPTGSVTWDEIDSGPVTDRIFGVATELRWRRAPWPLLPTAAGRVWAEYAGEDMLPGDTLPVPEISVPAAVLGLELIDPAWDLLGEYVETRHPDVLWYGNSGFPRGYSQDDWILGHPRGGAAETWLGLVRWRPAGTPDELEAKLRHTAWAMAGRLPGEATQTAVTLSWRRLRAGWLSEVALTWIREAAGPAGALASTDHVAVRLRLDP